jgi:hypothetical protein
MRRLTILSLSLFFSTIVFGQDTLPKFAVRNIGSDRIVISWVNPYDTLNQISIQTSHDSLKNYRTIISLTDPNARMNGFADTKALNNHMFYRLFIVKKSGDYFFTIPKQPVLDTSRYILPIPGTNRETGVLKKPPVDVRRSDWVPSFYIYTNKDGYVFINLPDAAKQKYHIKFYEEDQSFLFEIKTINQSGLTLDKINFIHAGWFLFELYNDEKLVEKNKFYLTKEF